MIKMYTSYTMETDDPKQAAADILDQLKPQERMLKNTIAIVYFHYDVADRIQEFAEAMPFKLIGGMTTYSGINGCLTQHGDVAIAVTMLTSSDVTFKIKTIKDIKNKPIEEMREEVKTICEDFCKKEKPKLIMPFLPTMPHFCGNDLLNAVIKYDKSLMLFGMHIFNIDGVHDTNYVLANGKISTTMVAMVALYGDVDPKFHISSSFTFSESFGETVNITDARLSTLKKVNGKPVLDYFKRYGLITPGNKHNTANLFAVPAILTYKNGSKVSCAFIGIDEENGFAIAARTIERGAKIVLSQLDGEKTLESAKDIIKEIITVNENDCLIFSSSARVWAIGSNLFTEMQEMEKGAKEYEEKHGEPLNYSIAYSGGEICPITDTKGNYQSMVHNYTMAICTFN